MSKDYSMKFKDAFVESAEENVVGLFSYNRVSSIFFNQLMNSLIDSHGYTENEALEFCQSKAPRLALDNKIGDMISKAAKAFAKADADMWHEDCTRWVKTL
jgi:hypothetical protein